MPDAKSSESVLVTSQQPELPARPWEGLEPEVATALRPGVDAVGDEVIDAIRTHVPAYSQPMEGAFGDAVRRGVTGALGDFVDMVEGAAPRPASDLYFDLGRAEARVGRALDSLLAAYRLGARIAWRRAAEAGAAAGLAPETLYLLAESIFAYIDELSAESAEGYAEERMAIAGAREARRRALVRMLVQRPAPDAAALEAAAGEADWEIPEQLAALAFEGTEPERLAARLGPGAIAASVGETGCALVPDPAGPGRRGQIERAAEGTAAALGPVGGWADAAASFQRATFALRLREEGRLPANGLTVVDDHLMTLIIERDRSLVGELAARRLAPLDETSPGFRPRLEETLLAWLDHHGSVNEVAAALYVHPQTVRYRLARLRELFGDELDDPDVRFELQLALRAGR